MANNRKPRKRVLMECAWLWSDRSTCERGHVGVVIARDYRIIVTGYNGAPSGLPHCDHTCTCAQYGESGRQIIRFKCADHEPGCPRTIACEIATHAEANAIAFAARNGVATDGSEMYVTMAPCIACARIIINAGLAGVHYDQPYRDMAGVGLLQSAGLKVWHTT